MPTFWPGSTPQWRNGEYVAVDRRFVGVGRPLHTHTAANHHAAQKNHDGDDGRGHEQKDQLFSIQLYLVKAFVCH